MIASIVVIVFSSGLLVFWLRYTCVLLLHDKQTPTEFPLFSFFSVRAEVQAGATDGKLQEALDRDYAVLRYLIGKTAQRDIEARLLVWDYRLLRLWCVVARMAFPSQAGRLIGEMADVLAVLAGKLRDARVPEHA